MNINLNAVHFTPDQKLVSFANKKLNKLDTFFEGIISAELILKVTKPEAVDNKMAEIKLSIPSNGYLFAKKEAATFEEAIDLAADAIRKQLTKFKEKKKEK
ncbi:ribosome hibernation-promoting factor, HPF/YfiA family [Sunxiuqinia indica]|jgi:ribosomal subunit interface protein|uniref:ribosome hibernation-promoting factor, HPF/YfiA family n=1 Tax=Sunxiuqinia indica TaxID=2692584 RepID=UPI00135B1CCA|nr:ribosome-associated translation inhibitor RaiA [Sunxiuqinia indica]